MKIGILGLGSIGMRHAKNLLAMGHEVWGFDPDDKRGMELLKNHGLVTGFFHGDHSVVTDRFADMREFFDALVIASPTPMHHDHLAIASMAKRPIFVEKPILDRDPHPALDLSWVKMVGYNLRNHSCVKRAKEWLDNGRIGRPLWAQFTLGQFSEKPPYLRDGVILNWSHELDLALYLLGPIYPGGIGSMVGFDSEGKDNIADINMGHTNGCTTHVHLDYLTKPEIRGFHICGDGGRISCDLSGRVITLYDTEGQVKRFCGEDSWNDNYIDEMEAFISRCDGKETIGCTGAEGLEVLKICLEVRRQAGLE